MKPMILMTKRKKAAMTIGSSNRPHLIPRFNKSPNPVKKV